MRIHGYLPLVVALGFGFAAHAQQGQPGSHFIENWDLNEDGNVSLSEATEKRGDLFYMFDQDENGFLNDAEYDLFDETRRADMDENAGGHKQGPMAAIDKAMKREFNDVNGDGQVSKDEFISRTPDWFTMMDRTGDGIVTTDDFRRKGG